jgi:hypothetical protein
VPDHQAHSREAISHFAIASAAQPEPQHGYEYRMIDESVGEFIRCNRNESMENRKIA